MENAASLFLFSFQRPENISVIPTKHPVNAFQELQTSPFRQAPQLSNYSIYIVPRFTDIDLTLTCIGFELRLQKVMKCCLFSRAHLAEMRSINDHT